MAGSRWSRIPVPTEACGGPRRSTIGGHWIPEAWLAHLGTARAARARNPTGTAGAHILVTAGDGACRNPPKVVQDRAKEVSLKPPRRTRERNWPRLEGQAFADEVAWTDLWRVTCTSRPEHLKADSEEAATPNVTGDGGEAADGSSSGHQPYEAPGLQQGDASAESNPTTSNAHAEDGFQPLEASPKETVEALLKRLRRATAKKRAPYRVVRKPDDFATEQLTMYEIALMKRRTQAKAAVKFGVYRDPE